MHIREHLTVPWACTIAVSVAKLVNGIYDARAVLDAAVDTYAYQHELELTKRLIMYAAPPPGPVLAGAARRVPCDSMSVGPAASASMGTGSLT